jgi:DNA polymerase-3 subunit delta'
MRFEGFAGNARAKEQLASLFSSGRLPHALILEGNKGTGRRTLAELIARAAVCSGDEKPCGICAGCLKAAAGSHPDISKISGTGAARSFHVDVIRSIRSDAYIKPNEANTKVYILAEADTMSEQAQNALLKILESPPERVLFILTCRSATNLLPTVRSRAQTVRVEEVSAQEAADFAAQQLPNTPREEILRAAEDFHGNIGSVLAALKDGSLSAARKLVPEIVRAVYAPRELELLKLTAPLSKDKELFSSVLDILSLLFGDECVLREGGLRVLSGHAVEA